MKNPVREVILTEKGGNTICYDAISGRYFKSDRDTINRAVNELNRQMRDDMYVTLNEFYYALGLDGTKLGRRSGLEYRKGIYRTILVSHLDANGTLAWLLIIGLRRFTIITPGNDITEKTARKLQLL